MKCNLVCVTISLFTVVLNVYFIFIYHYFFWPVGMAGTKHQSLFQPTEEGGLLTRALPSHDLCDSCLYVTPSGYRFMSHEVREIDGKLMNYKLNMFVGRDWVTEYLHKSILWVTKVCSSFLLGKERMIVKDDSSVVTVRPKHYKFFCREHPQFYEIEGSSFDPLLRKFSAMVWDHLVYFMDTTEKGDVSCITNSAIWQFRSYEKSRIEHADKVLLWVGETGICLTNRR